MAGKDNRPAQAVELRRRAEETARGTAAQSPEDLDAQSPEETRQTLLELRVHQIELEMQNDELRRTQAELDAARARYFDLYDLAPVGYCTLSESGLILEANLTAATLLGVARGTLIKQPIARFILKEDQDIYYLHRKQLFETGEPQAYELRMVKKDGTAFWAHLEATAAQDADGALIFRTVLSDIAERKRAEEKIKELMGELEMRVVERTALLEAANKELEAFCYSVSHDLRAPLRGIDGFSQALLDDYGEKLDDTAKSYLDRVRKAAQHMDRLIDDMLTLSRVTRSEFHYESVDLSNMVRAISEKLQQNNPDRTVDVIIRDGVFVNGDANLLQIALENLVDNAWKFTMREARPQFEFGKTVKDGKTACFIRDNGVGFDMAYVDKLFDAFNRLHTTFEFPGTGIGLATVQRIINRHGGQVWAEAEVEKGAMFYFTLPG
ncbi:MAG: PAS domain S-box protein [Deltaproteobacteria bacterium]|nr:MAG: PAS domain S-box protein [Deltaproteobacteria bacterium]